MHDLPMAKSDAPLASMRNKPIVNAGEPEILNWSGLVKIDEDRIIRNPVTIHAGTEVYISPGSSLIFRAPLHINGTQEYPVKILPLEKDKPWGVFSLMGPRSAGSTISHALIEGGSGGDVEGMRFTGMFSIHNTSGVVVDNVQLTNSHYYDDMMHVVYAEDITLSNVSMNRPRADGLDVDLSKKVLINGLYINNAGNDAVDLMGSDVTITKSMLNGSGDKGISVGEGSRSLVVSTILQNNSIGIESKDGSFAQLLHSELRNNDIQVSSYSKNWRYGEGGKVDIRKSILSGLKANYSIEKGSVLSINNSIAVPGIPDKKRIRIGPDVRQNLEDSHVDDDYGEGIFVEFSNLKNPPTPSTIGISK